MSVCRTATIADQEETKNGFDQMQRFLDWTEQNRFNGMQEFLDWTKYSCFDELQEFLESISQKRKRVKYTNPNLPHKCIRENIPFDTGLEYCILCGDPVAKRQRLNMENVLQLSVDLLELLRQYLDFPTRTYLYLAGFTPTGDSRSKFPEFFEYFKPTKYEIARKIKTKWNVWQKVEYNDDTEMDVFPLDSDSDSENELEFEDKTKSEYEDELDILEDDDAICVYEYIPIVRLLLLDKDFKTVKNLKLAVDNGPDEATEAILQIDPQFGSIHERKLALINALKNKNDRIVNLFKKEDFDRTSTNIFEAALDGGYTDWIYHMITLDRTNHLPIFHVRHFLKLQSFKTTRKKMDLKLYVSDVIS
jgi:hypothetical protein